MSYINSQNSQSNMFANPQDLIKNYSGYFNQEMALGKEAGFESMDQWSALRYGSVDNERYLRENKAFKEYSTNVAQATEEKSDSFWKAYSDNGFNILKTLSLDGRRKYYDEDLDEDTKQRLSVVGVDSADDFDDIYRIANLNNDIENGKIDPSQPGVVMSEVQNIVSAKQDEDENWDAAKSVFGGLIAGAIVGAGIALAPMTGGMSILAAAGLGAAIGGGISATAETAAEYTDSELLDKLRNANRNLMGAINNTTIGTVGKSFNMLGNVADTIVYELGGKQVGDKVSKANIFTMVGGTIKGMSEFISPQATEQYEGFEKFLFESMPSVVGSIAGYMTLGAVAGSALGGGTYAGVGANALSAPTTSLGKALKILSSTFTSGSYAELSVRAGVMLSEMDEVFSKILRETGDHGEAFRGSIATGALNWSILGLTNAIPGEYVRRGVMKAKSGQRGIVDIIKGFSKEMVSEASEEVGQLYATELGEHVGTGKKYYSDLKQYGEVAYLGAIGGVLGGGMALKGTAKQARIVEQSYNLSQETVYASVINNRLKAVISKNPKMTELEAKEEVIVWAYDNPSMKDFGVVISSATKSIISDEIIETSKQVTDRTLEFEEEANSILSRLDMKKDDKTKSNAALLVALKNTTQDQEIAKELETNMDMYVKIGASDIETFDHVNGLNKLTKARLNIEEDTNKIRNEISAVMNKVQINDKLKVSHELFNDVNNVLVGSVDAKTVLKKYNMTQSDVNTLYETQYITAEEQAIFNKQTNDYQAEVKRHVDRVINNPSKTNVKNAKANLKGVSNDFLRSFLSDEEYIQTANLLGLDFTDEFRELDTTSKLINDIAAFQDLDIEETSSTDKRNAYNSIKEATKSLKQEYGSLNKVPYDRLQSLGLIDKGIDAESIREIQRELAAQVRAVKKKPITTQPKEAKSVQEVKNSNEFYSNELNPQEVKLDKMRDTYYESVDNEVMNLETLPKEFKDKHGIEDISNIIEKDIEKSKISDDNLKVLTPRVGQVSKSFANVDVIGVGIDFKEGSLTLQEYVVGETIDETSHDYFFDREQIVNDLLDSNITKTLEDGTKCAI